MILIDYTRNSQSLFSQDPQAISRSKAVGVVEVGTLGLDGSQGETVKLDAKLICGFGDHMFL